MGKSIVNKIAAVGSAVTAWLSQSEVEDLPVLPFAGSKDANEKLATIVKEMWIDSKNGRINAFKDRPGNPTGPIQHWSNLRQLEGGNHWKVWLSRKEGLNNGWKHELVIDDISNQIRVRKSHITSAWHDFDVIPNISDISNIMNQERANSDWGRQIKLGTHKSMTEGTAWYKSIFDTTIDDRGIAREILVDNESIFPTPRSTGIEAIEGCWYIIHATMQTRQNIHRMHPKFDFKEIDGTRVEIENEATRDGGSLTKVMAKHTKTEDHLECWMDDDRLVAKPFSTDVTDQEHILISQGGDPGVKFVDNHQKHVQAHIDWFNEVESGSPIEERTAEDDKFIKMIQELVLQHIDEHIKAAEDEKSQDPRMDGSRMPMYPNGRKVVMVGGVIASDTPNPLGIPWRRLFHRVPCEDIGELWGRSMGEVLWNTNNTIDTMLSRIADASVAVSMPTPWMNIVDKPEIEKQGINNDPTVVHFFSGTPPVFPHGVSPNEPLQILQLMLEQSAKQMGINDVTYGKSPGAKSSGDLVEMLIRQNVVLVTGELNNNLSSAVSDMIETRLALMRIWYTEPRQYYIDGELQMVNVSELLSVKEVVDPQTQQPVKMPIGDFQVTVKPNSNLPNEWETKVGFVTQQFLSVGPDGAGILPREAVLDVIAEKYPDYGVNGKYYKMTEAVILGLQELAKQQAEAKQAQQIRQKIEGKGLSSITQ